MYDDGTTGHMATLSWHATVEGGVTLVELAVTAERPERVRVDNRLDGPVLPPRSGGRPEPGWDEDGFEGRVDPEGRLVLGYACPADPVDPPARLVDCDPVDDATESGRPDPREVVRALGDGGPPPDAVPDPTERERGPREVAATDSRADGGEDGLDRWLDDVERRLTVAEELAAVDSVAEAEAAVDRAGGIPAVEELVGRLDRDRDRLARLADRCERAHRRAERVDVPVGTLRRLA